MSARLPALRRADPRRWAAAAAVLAVPPAGWLAVHRPGLLAALLLGVPVVVLLVRGLSLSIDRALLAYLPVYVVADTLKRLVFVVGPDTAYVQYVPLAIKFALLVLLGAWGLGRRLQHGRFDAIDRALSIYLACVVVGVFATGALSIAGKVMLMPFAVGPALLFFAYREADRTEGWRDRFLTWLVRLGVAAAVYGLYQVVVGPSWIDRAWAEASNAFSIQAENVWVAMTTGATMRPYSFFADHFAHGYFLVAALLALLVRPSLWTRAARITIGVILLTALAVAMTRAAWTAVSFALAAVVVMRLLPSVRRLLPAATLGVYVVLSLAVTPIYDRFFPEQEFASATTARAFSLGTLAARRDPGTAFLDAARRYPLLGNPGEAAGVRLVTAKLGRDLAAAEEEERFDDAHNFLVSVAGAAGLPGTLAFVVFLLLVLRAGARSRGRGTVAAVVGLFLAGVAGSGTFVAGFFFAWCAFAGSRATAAGGAHD